MVVAGNQRRGCPTQAEHAPIEGEQRGGIALLRGNVDPDRIVWVDGQPWCHIWRAEAAVWRTAPLKRAAAAITRARDSRLQRLRRRHPELLCHRVILVGGGRVAQLAQV